MISKSIVGTLIAATSFLLINTSYAAAKITPAASSDSTISISSKCNSTSRIVISISDSANLESCNPRTITINGKGSKYIKLPAGCHYSIYTTSDGGTGRGASGYTKKGSNLTFNYDMASYNNKSVCSYS